MLYGVLFPGQGSQYLGMGADLFDARPDLLGDAADELLGWSLRDLCLNGPEEELTRTDKAQPALFALSYVLWEALVEAAAPGPAAGAGHSLGEYTALAASGAIDFTGCLGLVDARGRAMAVAAGAEPSGMAALMGADEATADAVCRQRVAAGGRIWVANLNAPGQIVVAGAEKDIGWLVENGRDLGIKRVIPLKVAGAFHSPFMQAAALPLRAALEEVSFRSPAFPVYSNVTAVPHDIEEMGDLLARQVVSPVRFSDTIRKMAEDGIGTFVHVGPGDVTAGMARKSAPEASVHVLNELGGVAEMAALLGSISDPGGNSS